MFALAKARAKRQGLPFTITLADIQIPKRCPMLNIALRTGIGTPPHMYAGREGIDAIDREICEWEIGRRVHAAKQVHCYLKDRAAVEGVPFDLDDSFFAEMVLSGVFSFFGVTISDAGLDFGIEDERQPKRGFLKRWLKRNCPPQKAAH